MAKAVTLVDNFNDNAQDTTKWFAHGFSPVETNGRVEIRPQLEHAPVGGYQSWASYDLTSSHVHIEVVHAPRQTVGMKLYLALERGPTGTLFGSDGLWVEIEDGRLTCGQTVSGARTVLLDLAYEPLPHHWIRVREQSGTIHWEFSSDGGHWVPFVASPRLIDVTQLYVKFGVWGVVVASPGMAVFDNLNVPECGMSRTVDERRLSARQVRVNAAELAAAGQHQEHVNNNDEANYPGYSFIGNYSKSLPHDALGDPDPVAYGILLRALQRGDPRDFEEIRLAFTTGLKLTNPQAGLTFDIAGPDTQERTMLPAPRFDSDIAAAEAGELYWMAVARDVYFGNYATDATISAAITSLNNEFPAFGGTTPVTTQNVFRGIYPGEQVGPYVSQFLLKGNTDTRKPDGLGRDANEGYVSYGAQVIDQRIIPAAANTDYLTTFSTWLNAQNGVDTRGQDSFDTVRRFIRNLRDGATYVHFDQVLNAYYNAAWILMTEPTGNQLSYLAGTTGRPQIDLEFPKNAGNPYDPPGTAMDSKTQVGFGTFGPIHLLQVLSEVLGRAIRAVWWQKWGVHRRLRPEEYGGRVHNQITGARAYGLHTSITTSLTTGSLAPYFGNTGEKFPSSYLLPQAYPEGAPTHPAYGAGHATGSGAMATILKAFFDETMAIENPVLADSTGTSLVAYTGGDAGQMTVGGELNKLAGNIAIFRNAAGVHWRSDYTESLPFGEAIAIRLLQEMSLGFNEDDAYFQLTKFDGTTIRIFDGKVVPAV